jgi:hypothetical protein
VRFNGVKVAKKEDELSVRLKINDLLRRRDFETIEILNGEKFAEDCGVGSEEAAQA